MKNTTEESSQVKAFKFSIKVIWLGIISLFYAVTSFAFGLASIFLLLGLVNYFGQDISSHTLLLNLFDQIINNMMIFLSLIFVYEFWRRWKE